MTTTKITVQPQAKVAMLTSHTLTKTGRHNTNTNTPRMHEDRHVKEISCNSLPLWQRQPSFLRKQWTQRIKNNTVLRFITCKVRGTVFQESWNLKKMQLKLKSGFDACNTLRFAHCHVYHCVTSLFLLTTFFNTPIAAAFKWDPDRCWLLHLSLQVVSFTSV